jgi:hypothetical protein
LDKKNRQDRRIISTKKKNIPCPPLQVINWGKHCTTLVLSSPNKKSNHSQTNVSKSPVFTPCPYRRKRKKKKPTYGVLICSCWALTPTAARRAKRDARESCIVVGSTAADEGEGETSGMGVVVREERRGVDASWVGRASESVTH